MQDRLREMIGRWIPGREKLPAHVSRHGEHGLVYTKEDKFSLTRNEIDIPGTDGYLNFDSRAQYQGAHLQKMQELFPDYFPKFYGFTKNKTGFMMEYIPGPTLYRYAEAGGKVPPQIMEAIYKARDEIHAAGLAHGDFKEDNVILNIGEDGTVVGFKLIDPVPPVLKEGEGEYSCEQLYEILREADREKMLDWFSISDSAGTGE